MVTEESPEMLRLVVETASRLSYQGRSLGSFWSVGLNSETREYRWASERINRKGLAGRFRNAAHQK